jgi:DNA-binding Lrp family transcriptional regulator
MVEKNQLFELEILKHVEKDARLNNRLAAARLGCSVKLAHELLRKMVDRGCLHIRKLHSRRWDYFLTPKGIAEKARLTREFISFSRYFYHEARKASSMLCRCLAERGIGEVAFIGTGDLAEISYLGVKEWNLELKVVYGVRKDKFLGVQVKPFSEFNANAAEAFIICTYNEHNPMLKAELPEGLKRSAEMYWLFDKEFYEYPKEEIPH